MGTSPLTKEEKDWVARVEKALKSKGATSRMVAFTIGDDNIVIYDRNVYAEYVKLHGEGRDVCVTVDRSGSALAELWFPFEIESTAG